MERSHAGSSTARRVSNAPWCRNSDIDPPRELALDTTTVTLYVNGAEIPATGVRTPARTPRNDKPSVFDILFFWRFPAKFFEPGLREFSVHWATTLGGSTELWKALTLDVQY